MLEKDEKISGGQAGFRPYRSCVDHVYTLGKIIQGRKDAGLTTYCFFLDVQKAYGTLWRNGMLKNMWETGIRGKMWRMMKSMTECARSAVMLDGEISIYVEILQGVAQRCTLTDVFLFAFGLVGLLSLTSLPRAWLVKISVYEMARG